MKFLVAVDLVEEDRKVIDSAIQFAHACNGHIVLLHVAPPDPEFVGYGVGPQGERDAMAKEYRREHELLQKLGGDVRASGIDCVAILAQGSAAEVILTEAKNYEASIIVVGTHSKGVFARFFSGSTSLAVIHRSHVPLLVVPVGADAA